MMEGGEEGNEERYLDGEYGEEGEEIDYGEDGIMMYAEDGDLPEGGYADYGEEEEEDEEEMMYNDHPGRY